MGPNRRMFGVLGGGMSGTMGASPNVQAVFNPGGVNPNPLLPIGVTNRRGQAPFTLNNAGQQIFPAAWGGLPSQPGVGWGGMPTRPPMPGILGGLGLGGMARGAMMGSKKGPMGY